jgi:hypothetical protein
MSFHDMDVWRQRLAPTDDFAMLLNRAANIAEVFGRTATALVVAMVIRVLVIAMIIALIAAMTIASIILGATLRTALLAVVLMLAGAIVVMTPALIGRRGLNQRTGAEHQYA